MVEGHNRAAVLAIAACIRRPEDAADIYKTAYCVLHEFIDEGRWPDWDALSALVHWDDASKLSLLEAGIGARRAEVLDIVRRLDSGQIPRERTADIVRAYSLLGAVRAAVRRRVEELGGVFPRAQQLAHGR